MLRNEKKATGNMKKRLLTLVLAGVMAVGSAIPAMAAAPAEEAGKITVYLAVENTMANATTNQDTRPATSYLKSLERPVKLEVDEGTTVLQAMIAAGLEPMKWEDPKTEEKLIPCTGDESYFVSLAGTGTLEKESTLNASNTYLYDKIATIKTDYYDAAYEAYEEDWDIFEEYYAFMDGWHTPQVQESGFLTARDFNNYSGWMFTINNLKQKPGENPYTVGSKLSDGDVIRVEWTNGGGWDLGFPIEVYNINMEFITLPAVVERIDRTDAIKAEAVAK